MTEYSNNTLELTAVAKTFQDNTISSQDARVDFETAELPSDFWPMFTLDDPAQAYADLVEVTLTSARLLQDTIVAVGDALSAVAEDYRKQEEQNGAEFSYLGEED